MLEGLIILALCFGFGITIAALLYFIDKSNGNVAADIDVDTVHKRDIGFQLRQQTQMIQNDRIERYRNGL